MNLARTTATSAAGTASATTVITAATATAAVCGVTANSIGSRGSTRNGTSTYSAGRSTWDRGTCRATASSSSSLQSPFTADRSRTCAIRSGTTSKRRNIVATARTASSLCTRAATTSSGNHWLGRRGKGVHRRAATTGSERVDPVTSRPAILITSGATAAVGCRQC